MAPDPDQEDLHPVWTPEVGWYGSVNGPGHSLGDGMICLATHYSLH